MMRTHPIVQPDVFKKSTHPLTPANGSNLYRAGSVSTEQLGQEMLWAAEWFGVSHLVKEFQLGQSRYKVCGEIAVTLRRPLDSFYVNVRDGSGALILLCTASSFVDANTLVSVFNRMLYSEDRELHPPRMTFEPIDHRRFVGDGGTRAVGPVAEESGVLQQ